MSELLIIAVLCIILFPPHKWPMVLFHFAKGIKWLQTIKEDLIAACKIEAAQYELSLRQKNAEQADNDYQTSNSPSPKNQPEA